MLVEPKALYCRDCARESNLGEAILIVQLTLQPQEVPPPIKDKAPAQDQKPFPKPRYSPKRLLQIIDLKSE